MSFRGVPTLYIHSLLATTNDLANVERTGRTRSINRGHLSLTSLREELACDRSIRSEVLNTLLAALKTRQAQPAFLSGATQRVINIDTRTVTMWREAAEQTLLIIASVTGSVIDLSTAKLGIRAGTCVDRYTGKIIEVRDAIRLEPWQVLWLEVTNDRVA